jgi:hypothetical protein
MDIDELENVGKWDTQLRLGRALCIFFLHFKNFYLQRIIILNEFYRELL